MTGFVCIKILTAVKGVTKLSVDPVCCTVVSSGVYRQRFLVFFSDVRSNVIFSFLDIPNVQCNAV